MTISASSGVSFTECEFDTVPGGTCVIQVRSIKCGLDNALPTKEETGLFQDGSERTVVCMYAYVVVEVFDDILRCCGQSVVHVCTRESDVGARRTRWTFRHRCRGLPEMTLARTHVSPLLTPVWSHADRRPQHGDPRCRRRWAQPGRHVLRQSYRLSLDTKACGSACGSWRSTSCQGRRNEVIIGGRCSCGVLMGIVAVIFLGVDLAFFPVLSASLALLSIYISPGFTEFRGPKVS